MKDVSEQWKEASEENQRWWWKNNQTSNKKRTAKSWTSTKDITTMQKN